MTRNPYDDSSDYDDEFVGGGVRCRDCGALCTWHDTGVRMALMGPTGRLHVCDVSDDFDVIDPEPSA